MSKELEKKVAKLTKLVLRQSEMINKLAQKQGVKLTKKAQVGDVSAAEPEVRSKLLNALLGFGVTGLTLSLGAVGDNLSIEKLVVQCPETADLVGMKNKVLEVAKTLVVNGKKVEVPNPNFFVAEHPGTVNLK